jgi:uncharacterized protein Yka (UPF0111/DUF47 family)
MKWRRWFLPEVPDMLGMLRRQTAITVAGMDHLIEWANGDPTAERRLRDCEHAADDAKRELRAALTEALTTPLDAEDLYELSRGLDDVLNSAKDTVREADVMGTEPDAAIAAIAAHLGEGTRRLAAAFDALASGATGLATQEADAAVKSQRRLEREYRGAMSGLLGVDDVREVTARRELYRRLARTSDALVHVAERVWYSVLKEG